MKKQDDEGRSFTTATRKNSLPHFINYVRFTFKLDIHDVE